MEPFDCTRGRASFVGGTFKLSPTNTLLSWPLSAIALGGCCSALLSASLGDGSIMKIVMKNKSEPEKCTKNGRYSKIRRYSQINVLTGACQKCQLTQQIETSIEDGNGSTVSNVLGQWIDQNRQIAAHIVHDKEEDADCGRSHLHGYNFHQDSEHDTEPHLSWKSKKLETGN